VLRAVTLPIRRTVWSIDPGGASDEVTRFVADNLGPAGPGADAGRAGAADPGPVLLVGARPARAADADVRAHAVRAGVPDP
jgi:hypothetical protein